MGKQFDLWAGKVKKLAFRQFYKLESLGKELFGFIKNKDHKRHAPYLHILLQWCTVPFTLWVLDFAGFGRMIAAKINAREEIDHRIPILLKKLEQLPSASTQERVSKHESDIQTGNYEKFLRNSAKYDAMEKDLPNNPRIAQGWNEIQSLFDITKYRNNVTGIVRHTHLLDRGYRPSRWEYDRADDKERWLFQAFFDLFCAENNLLGMEFDRPLLARLTVIRTIFGTQLTVPRHMSFNAFDDMNWGEFQEVHADEDLGWHGPKASEGNVSKKAMLRIFYEAHEYAESQGWTGDKRWSYVENKCGLRPNTDRGTLRRLRRQSEVLWEKEHGTN
ncbi:MAG: hypothetical protein JWM68_3681 [Verrucomicrobiales bacterium]|nr:hypothetical protein [Verrucomicrobiales bacterium]